MDPVDGQAVRSVGHQRVDEMLDALRTVRPQPTLRPIPEAVKRSFQTSAPMQASSPGSRSPHWLAFSRRTRA
ncbi:MAG: hypothetical protein ACLQDQ_03065 [Myxococcaceae bacterium]